MKTILLIYRWRKGYHFRRKRLQKYYNYIDSLPYKLEKWLEPFQTEIHSSFTSSDGTLRLSSHILKWKILGPISMGVGVTCILIVARNETTVRCISTKRMYYINDSSRKKSITLLHSTVSYFIFSMCLESHFSFATIIVFSYRQCSSNITVHIYMS